jgi:hypothetical protein
MARMATLSSKRRRSLPKSAFAIPSQRKYPIHDKAHARNALARAAQSGTSGAYATVRRKVLARYPSLKKTTRSGGSRRKRGTRR